MAENDFFVWGKGGAKLTPEELENRKQVEAALLARGGIDTSPVADWTQGLARVANAAAGSFRRGRLERAGNDIADVNKGLISSILGGGAPAVSGSAVPMTSGAAQVGAGNPAAPVGGHPDVAEYIRQSAASRGIDPGIALRVAGHEGLNVFDPSQPDRGGDEGSSFGPFQLHYSGMSKSMPNAGIGDEFTKATGLDARDPSTWKQQVDFSLDWAKNHGWDPWMGAKAEGITGKMGIGQAPVQVASAQPQTASDAIAAVAPQPSAMTAYADPSVVSQQQAAPKLPAPTNVSAAPPVAVAPQQRVAQALSAPQQDQSQIPGLTPAILNALTNPQATPQTRAIAQALMQQQAASAQAQQQFQLDQQKAIFEQGLKQKDPAYQADLSLKNAQADQLIHPRIAPAEQANIDLNRDKFAFERDQAGKLTPEQEATLGISRERLALDKDKANVTPDITEYNFAKSNGYTGSFAQYQLDLKKSGAQNTTINTGEGNKFYNTLDEKNATIFSNLSDAGIQGHSKLGQIDQLDKLLQSTGSGWSTALKAKAGDYGINTEKLNDIQAASALLSKMIPAQREPGSGPVSDADLAGFRNSLPRLINQPGGNATIINTMRGLTQYQIDQGAIADKVANREITPAEGRQQIANLPNPLANFQAPEPGKEADGWKEIAPGVRVRKAN